MESAEMDFNFNLLDNISLYEIFKYLDVKSMLRASETCVKFEEVLSSSKRLMRKLKFRISLPLEEENRNTILTGLRRCNQFLTRKYSNVQIIRLRDNILNYNVEMRDAFLQIISKLAESNSVTDLEINNCYLLRDDLLKCLLKPFGNLVELKLENLVFSDDFMPSEIYQEENRSISLSFPNLKTLRLIQCDFYCLLMLKTHEKLKTLEISIPSYNRTDVEELENFLLKQKELKELKLASFRFNSTYSSHRLSKVPFQLDTLCLKDTHWDIFDHCFNFLLSQKKLKHFELRRFQRYIMPKETNEVSFNQIMAHILIKNPLETLIIETVNTFAYMKDAEFLQNMCNNNLKHLSYIRDTTDNSELFKIFTRIFPKIKCFEFSESSNNLNNVLQNLNLFKDLSDLQITTNPSSLDNISLDIAKNLTSFKFYAINEDKSFDRLKKIFEGNSQIKDLALNIEPLTMEEIFELILNFSSTLISLKIQDLHLTLCEADLFVKNFDKLQSIMSDVPPSNEVLKFLAASNITFKLMNGNRF